MAAIRLVVNGAAGRMGQRVIALAAAQPEFQIVAALDHAGHPQMGSDAGLVAGVRQLDVPLTSSLDCEADVAIDFSTPEGTLALVDRCLTLQLPLVVATTGLKPETQEVLRRAGANLPLVWSPSMSLAVNLAMKLTQIAASALANHHSGADVEIIERHHRFKEDSPSGTALKFGEIVTAVMGQAVSRHGREGRPGKRPHGEIGYHALRTGDNPGQHTIVFGMLGETLEINVAASNRDCYAEGALAAAKFLVGRKPGLYSIQNVLGL